MRRRSRAGGEPVKTRRHKTAARKRGNAPKVAHHRESSAAGLNKKVALFKRERDEALEQQKATAEVLQVISRSTFDLQTVLDTLVESAARLCDADHAWLFRRDGEFYRWAASYGHSKEDHERIKRYMMSLVQSPGRGSGVARAASEGRPVQIADVLADPEYTLLDLQKIGHYRTTLGIPLLRGGVSIGVLSLTRSEPQPFSDKQIELLTIFAAQAVIAIENTRLLNELRQRTTDAAQAVIAASARYGGARSGVCVPMLKDDALVGAFTIYRQEVRPFTDRQIALLTNFAAQAIIAIENTRLLNELHQRTADLSESLEQQTATSQVLGVISSSPGELEPVFQAMLENAVRICEAKFGVMFRFDDDVSYPVAMLNLPPVLDEYFRTRGRRKPTPGSDLENLWKSKQAVHTIDMLQSSNPSPPARLAGARTQLAVPMLMDDELVGAIAIYRQEVRPFTDKQIALVTNFADQAVIAIENTRLLNELRQSLQQQTATSEVLGVISSSPGELQPVFDAMLENATRICEASFGNLLLYNGDVFRHVALHNAPQDWAVEQQRDPVAPRRSARMLYRVTETKQVVHVAYIVAQNPEEPIAKIAGARTLLIAPMLKENDLIGVHPEPLTDPDLILSHHPARATARRLPPSIEHWVPPAAGWTRHRLTRFNVSMACSLRSTGITPLPRYYKAVRL